MKPAHLALPLLAFTTLVSFAQLAVELKPASTKTTAVASTEQDKAWQAGMDQSRAKIESSLKDYLVVFDAPNTSDGSRLGVPLVSLADNTLNLAYDSTGKGLMAQWKLFQTDERGNKLNYQAYLGSAGAVSLVISARF